MYWFIFSTSHETWLPRNPKSQIQAESKWCCAHVATSEWRKSLLWSEEAQFCIENLTHVQTTWEEYRQSKYKLALSILLFKNYRIIYQPALVLYNGPYFYSQTARYMAWKRHMKCSSPELSCNDIPKPHFLEEVSCISWNIWYVYNIPC